MKKIAIFILIATIGFGFSGCGKKDKSVEEKAAKNSIVDWLDSKQSAECRIKVPEGEVLIRVKDEKVRIDGLPVMFELTSRSDGAGTNLTVNDTVYMWGDKGGMKIDLKKIPREEGAPDPKENWKDMVKNWQELGFQYECKNLSLSDDYFSPPADVEFKDFSPVLEIAPNMEANSENTNLEGATESLELNSENMNSEELEGATENSDF